MAFTNPPTVTTGEVADASDWNTYIRDNLIVTMHLLGRLSADQTFTTTTFTDVTGLSFAVAASDVWYFETHMVADIPNAADMKVQWTYPTGTTGLWAPVSYHTANGQLWMAGTGTSDISGAALSTETQNKILGGQGGVKQGIVLKAIFEVSTTAGTIQLQAAEQAASGTLTVYKNAFIAGMRLN